MAVRTPIRERRRAHAEPGRSRAVDRGFLPVVVVWSSWLVLMAGANLATPLYAVYASRFGFSSLVLTLIFATYAVVLVPSLILCGRLSDRFGRRPVMLAGLGVACAGLLVFAFAQSAAWLYGARALQGLAVGMISGAATAALVELDPTGDRRRAAMFAGLSQAGGSAAGPLLAGRPLVRARVPRDEEPGAARSGRGDRAARVVRDADRLGAAAALRCTSARRSGSRFSPRAWSCSCSRRRSAR